MSDFSLTLVLRLKTSKIINGMANVQIKSERITPFGGILQAGHKSLRTEKDKPNQSLRVQVLCKQSGIAERISVPAKWIRTARHYQLNIYTDNKSYKNPFALADG